MLSKDMKTSLSMLEEMKMNGVDIKRLTLDLVDILKDVVIYKNTEEASLMFVLSKTHLNLISPYISCEEAFDFIDILMDASEKYARVVNPAIYFELAILKMCNHVKDEKVVYVEKTQQSHDKGTFSIKEKNVNTDEEEYVEYVDDAEDDDQMIQEDIPTFEFEKEEEVEEEVEGNIKVDPSDIMNILVQANRKILESIQERWPIIKRYLANLNTAKSAAMLCDGTAVAASQGGLIIAFEFEPAVNAVNYYKNYNQLSQFLSEILGDEYKFIAIQQDEWIKTRSRFIELKKAGKLPAPREITLKHIDGKNINTVELNEAQKFAVDLFGDIVEFRED